MKTYICYNSLNEPEPFAVIANSPHGVAEAVTVALTDLCGGVRKGFYRKHNDVVVKWEDSVGIPFSVYCIPAKVYGGQYADVNNA
jgi:hypothetical protein